MHDRNRGRPDEGDDPGRVRQGDEAGRAAPCGTSGRWSRRARQLPMSRKRSPYSRPRSHDTQSFWVLHKKDDAVKMNKDSLAKLEAFEATLDGREGRSGGRRDDEGSRWHLLRLPQAVPRAGRRRQLQDQSRHHRRLALEMLKAEWLNAQVNFESAFTSAFSPQHSASSYVLPSNGVEFLPRSTISNR